MSGASDQFGLPLEAAGARSTRLAVMTWGVVFVVALVVGGVVLFAAVSRLDDAHLYRQRTGEGLKFLWVGSGLLVAHCVLGVATLAAVRLSSASPSASARRVLVASAVLIVAVVIAADLLAVWVEAHGDRCIGRCG